MLCPHILQQWKMSSISCLGCKEQKRSKVDKFYSTVGVAKISINDLRQKYNVKKWKLNDINEIPVASKICKSCYDLMMSNSRGLKWPTHIYV